MPNYQGSPEFRIHKLNSKIMRDVQTRLGYGILWHCGHFLPNLHFICSRLDAGKAGIQCGCPTNLSASYSTDKGTQNHEARLVSHIINMSWQTWLASTCQSCETSSVLQRFQVLPGFDGKCKRLSSFRFRTSNVKQVTLKLQFLTIHPEA